MKPILQVSNLSKHYKDAVTQATIKAVDGIDFEIYPNEVTGIFGESGCGKSTVLKLLVALEEATAGEILFNQRPLADWLKKEPLAFRRKIQMIFQNPYQVFDRRQTVKEILLQVLRIHNIGESSIEKELIIRQSLEEVGLTPAGEYLERYPHELSGGQLQRVSILRSILLEPDIIVADEPVSMLDVSVRAEIIEIIMRAIKQSNRSMLIVSHDILTISQIADRIIVMFRGKIVEIAAAETIINNPIHPYTQILIANALDKEVDQNVIESLTADFTSKVNSMDIEAGVEMIAVSEKHLVNVTEFIL